MLLSMHQALTFRMEYNGNTQVTCHMGMPSCGQRHRNVFIVYLLTCTITNTIIKSFPCPASMRLVSGLFPVSPPTHSCIITLHLTPTQTQPGRGGLVEGVHLPSPSTFAPWSSRRQVACFHAPCRLPGQVNTWLTH